MGRLRSWFDEHLALSALGGFVRGQVSKPVPRRLSWLYTAGTVAAFFFAVQFLTGLLLLMAYVPDEKLAYASVQGIEHRMPLGSLVRQIHAWGASFIVIVLLLHVFKVLWHGSYKRPRELTWLVGFVLLVMTLAFCLSGYLLPWNQLGFWATKVAVAGAGSVPGIGRELKGFICGGEDVCGQTIGRFFALHVMLLPLLLVILMGAHLALVIGLGIAPPTSVTEEEQLGHKGALEVHGSEPFFPRQVYRELLVLNIGFALLVTLAVYSPWELGEPKSSTTPEGIKPEWYFLPFYQFLKYFDDQLYAYVPFLGTLEKRFGITSEFLGIACVNCVGLLVFLLPFLDRGRERRIARRPIFAVFALLLVVGTAFLGLLGYLSERRVTFMGEVYEFSAKGYPRRVPPGEAAAPTAEPAPARAAEAAAAPASTTPPAPAVAAGEASYRLDGLPPGGTCGTSGCHEEEIEKWRGSVHDRNQKECRDCHGGIDTKPPDPLPDGLTAEAFAHLTIAFKKKTGEARRPSKKEVPDFCGRCHEEVRGAFSPAHLEAPPEGQSAKNCVNCHSNHAVAEAGDATYEAKGAYSDPEDPRTGPFLAARTAFREVEADVAGAEELLAKLRRTGYPAARFEEDLKQAREKELKSIRHLVHGLGSEKENLARRAAEIRESVGLTASEIRRELARRDDLWKVVAGVWAAAGALSALIVWRLRAIPSGPPATSGTRA